MSPTRVHTSRLVIHQRLDKTCELDGDPKDNFEMIQWCLDNGYKIPKWLLMIGIKCPFVRASIFQGKHGPVNFSLIGPEGGPLVIGFHGFGANIATFTAYSDAMVSNGFQFLTFDLYGHGLSAYPRYRVFGNTFTVDFFVDQTEELLEHLQLQHCTIAAVVGVSMGACIAAAFCKRNPDLVERCIFISPAGLIPRRPKKVAVLKALQCCIPCVPGFYSKCCFTSHVRKVNEGVALDAATNRVLWSLFVTRRGPSSFLGLVNRMPLWTGKSLYQHIGKFGKPTLCIFGAQDTLTPPSSAPKFCSLMPNCHVVVFSKADHLVSFKLVCQVSSLWLGFLSVPPDARVKDYKNWLPFDSLGRYIPRWRRFVGAHPGGDVVGGGDTFRLQETQRTDVGTSRDAAGAQADLGQSDLPFTSLGESGGASRVKGAPPDSFKGSGASLGGQGNALGTSVPLRISLGYGGAHILQGTVLDSTGTPKARHHHLTSHSDEFKDAIDYDDHLQGDVPKVPMVVIETLEQRYMEVPAETSGDIAASGEDYDEDGEEEEEFVDAQRW